MNRNIQKIMMVMSLLLLVFASSCCFAENGIRMDGQIGFDGVVQQGSVWRLSLNVENYSDKEIIGYISVNVAKDVVDDYDEVRMSIELETGKSAEYHMDVFPFVPQNALDVRLFSEDGSILAFTTVPVKKAIPSDAMTIGVWGRQKLADALESYDKMDEYGRKENVSTILLSTETFPENEEEAAAFGLIIIEEHSWDELSLKQQQALIAWMKDEGYLVVGTDEQKEMENWTSALATRKGKDNIKPSKEAEVRAILSDLSEMEEEKERLENVELLIGGHAIICGFSLSDDLLLKAAEQEQIWRRVLTAIGGRGYTFDHTGKSNVKFSQYLNTQEKVNKGKGILPTACLLGIYVMLVGSGLYVLLKRRDASKWIWVAIPVCAVICGAGIGIWGAVGKMSAPAAAQVLIVNYDKDGDLAMEEQTLVNYAGQQRKTISTQEGDAIESAGYQVFYSYGKENVDLKNMQVRNVVTLGDKASFEMESKPTWLGRELLIHRKNTPEGKIHSSAWMDEDGLYAQVENGTNMTLKNAVLMTSWGYARAEQIASGETKTFFLPRAKESIYSTNENIGILIPEGEALLFPTSIYSVEYAYVNPELAEGKELALTSEERERRELLSAKISLGQTSNNNWTECYLVAESPEIQCSQLLIDGEPIVNTVQNVVISCNIPMQEESPSGYLYAGWNKFPLYEVEEGTDGKPYMGAEKENAYIYGDGNYRIGYDLSAIDCSKIQTIRIENAYRRMSREFTATIEVYDHRSCEWILIPSSYAGYDDIALSVSEMDGIIGENGELFLRIQMKNGDDYGGIYAPTITVEGGRKE